MSSENHKFKWVVEIEVDQVWVEDGFELTEARMKEALAQMLPFAYSHEFGAKIVSAPDPKAVKQVQGYEDGEQCDGCGGKFPDGQLSYGPDPYAEEINNDRTPLWLCEECWRESANDI